MITCIIIDDEQHAIDLLSDYARESGRVTVLATSTSPVDGLTLIRKHQPDVVFLDIQMPRLSGMNIMETLQGRQPVIFCTAYAEFASEAYDWDAVDYLLKPVRFERFLRAISKLGERTGQTSIPDDYETDYIFVKTESKRKLLKINIRDIVLVEGMKNYVCIHHNGTKTMALLNLKDLEDRLPGKYFIRTHKSYIVNLPAITGITDDEIHLQQTTTPGLIGTAYREVFMQRMREKLMEKPK